ncbi:hypothetical protein RUM43_004433 [Polyplax serrata]|uniref:Uncharacterized protein n=1 Tax=Polyplax serrata TaxID=468196 RepID=A0AAN8SCC6_POLSC
MAGIRRYPVSGMEDSEEKRQPLAEKERKAGRCFGASDGKCHSEKIERVDQVKDRRGEPGETVTRPRRKRKGENQGVTPGHHSDGGSRNHLNDAKPDPWMVRCQNARGRRRDLISSGGKMDQDVRRMTTPLMFDHEGSDRGGTRRRLWKWAIGCLTA